MASDFTPRPETSVELEKLASSRLMAATATINHFLELDPADSDLAGLSDALFGVSEATTALVGSHLAAKDPKLDTRIRYGEFGIDQIGNFVTEHSSVNERGLQRLDRIVVGPTITRATHLRGVGSRISVTKHNRGIDATTTTVAIPDMRTIATICEKGIDEVPPTAIKAGIFLLRVESTSLNASTRTTRSHEAITGLAEQNGRLISTYAAIVSSVLRELLHVTTHHLPYDIWELETGLRTLQATSD